MDKKLILYLTYLFISMVNTTSNYICCNNEEDIEIPTPSSQCTDDINPRVRVFGSFRTYKTNNVSFDGNDGHFKGNYVEINGTVKELPEKAFATKYSNQIIKLILSNKNIQRIHNASFQYLDCLKHLDLQHNNITNITERMFYPLSRLLTLNISYNAIEYIGENYFREQKELVKLNLSHNKIISIGKYAFLNLMELIYLDLSFNNLKVMDPDTFSNTIHLQVLRLNNNNITYSFYEEWRNLYNLRYLDLSNNALKMFDFHAVNCLKVIIELNLNNNQLSNLDTGGIKRNFRSMRSLNINNNMFDCAILMNILQDLRSTLLILDGFERTSSNVEGIFCMRWEELTNDFI